VIGVAITLGVLLSAMQTPLYRILEGYLLWPRRLVERGRSRHIGRRRHLTATAEGLHGFRAALARERAQRYPNDDSEVVATMLGNAIRRFETYGWNRYRLNTQTLWYRIQAAAPDAATKAVDTARASVDFFVCLLYGHLLVALAALVALASGQRGEPRLAICLAITVVVAVVSYRLAVTATDEWSSAVRGVTDLSRVPLAAALGLKMPETLEEERQMWRGVYWLDREPYSEEASEYLSPYRLVSPKESD